MANNTTSDYAKKTLDAVRRVAVKQDPYVHLKEFVTWVRTRRQLLQNPNAPVDEDTLEYVVQGIERFLEGKKPWSLPRGNKSRPDIMWKVFYLAHFTGKSDPYKQLRGKRHTEEGGLYEAIGNDLHITAKAVESHERKAKRLCDTQEGQIEFAQWLCRYKGASISCVQYK